MFPVDKEGFRQRAKEQAAQIIKTAKLDRDPELGIEAAKFMEIFNKRKLFDDYFEVTITANYEVYLGSEFQFGPPPKPQPNTGDTKPAPQPERPTPVDTID